MDILEQTGHVVRFKCARCGEEVSGLLEPRQHLPPDPTFQVFALFSTVDANHLSKEILRIRQLVPILQRQSVSELATQLKASGRIEIGTMRGSKVDELAETASAQGLTLRLVRSPLDSTLSTAN
jgi:hypothetical protein